MTDSQKLLAEYIKTGSDAAFRDLVTRYLDLVYSAAVRLVDGDAHMAQDIAQTVFVDLAKMARSLPADVMIGGWLHRHTCFVAQTLMRGDRRRRARERQAAEMNALQEQGDSNLGDVAHILDEAINQLGSEERTAILLRFFEQLDFRSVGEAIGSTDDAAKKRVSRALDKLEQLLSARGVTLSATALAGALATEAVKAAPAGLVASIAGSALATSAGAGTTLFTLFKVMTGSKLSCGVFGIVIATGVFFLVKEHRVQARLRNENAFLRQQVARMAADAQDLSNQLVQTANVPALSDDQMRELLRLRGEVGALKRQLAGAKPGNPNPPAASPTDNSAEQSRQVAIGKMDEVKVWLLAFHRYAADHQGQFPSGFDQVSTELRQVISKDLDPGQSPLNAEEFADSTNHFELFYQGRLNDITNWSGTIVMREKDSWPAPNGGWCRTYGFADGHTEIHKADDGDFAPWEARHLQSSNGQ